MTFLEFKAELDQLTGVSAHGWKKIAAEMLGVTERALYDAEKRGEAGPKLVRKLKEVKARADAQNRDWTPLRGEAGRWAIAVPEDRAGGHVVCEVIVTHLHRPRFTAFFIFSETGSVERRVAEYEPADATELARLVETAQGKAGERCRAEKLAWKTREARAELIQATHEATGIDKGELSEMTSIDLVALKEKFDQETFDEVNDLFKKSIDTVPQYETDAELIAYLDGIDVGQLRLMKEGLDLIRDFGGEAAEMAIKVAGAYHLRRVVRRHSLRRAK